MQWKDIRGFEGYYQVSDTGLVRSMDRDIPYKRSAVSHCVNNRMRQAGGFIWEKIEKCNDYLGDESTAEDELPLEAQEQFN